MINYPEYKPLEGGKFLKLKERLQSEGDELVLECVDGKLVDAKDTQFGTAQLEMRVKENGVECLLNCDAPDEKNEFQGSQIYRGIKDNNIQPGDTFVIKHGGRMNNKYKTVIYDVLKRHTEDATEPPLEEPPF